MAGQGRGRAGRGRGVGQGRDSHVPQWPAWAAGGARGAWGTCGAVAVLRWAVWRGPLLLPPGREGRGPTTRAAQHANAARPAGGLRVSVLPVLWISATMRSTAETCCGRQGVRGGRMTSWALDSLIDRPLHQAANPQRTPHSFASILDLTESQWRCAAVSSALRSKRRSKLLRTEKSTRYET